MIEVRRAAGRFETDQPGIRTYHCFSAGAHYDPDNVSLGPLVAVDEHRVAAGAGFDRHAHRGVCIVSWVLDGTLRHEDAAGHIVNLRPGRVLVQDAGRGIEHSERNASGTDPLRFVQMSLLGDGDEPRVLLADLPLQTRAGQLTVHRTGALRVDAPLAHLYVARGRFETGDDVLVEGDAVRADEPLDVDGAGELLVWSLVDRRDEPVQGAEPPATS